MITHLTNKLNNYTMNMIHHEPLEEFNTTSFTDKLIVNKMYFNYKCVLVDSVTNETNCPLKSDLIIRVNNLISCVFKYTKNFKVTAFFF